MLDIAPTSPCSFNHVHISCQAKLYNRWDDYVGQVAAEIIASREEFAMNVLKKRKSEAVEAMPEVSL